MKGLADMIYLMMLHLLFFKMYLSNNYTDLALLLFTCHQWDAIIILFIKYLDQEQVIVNAIKLNGSRSLSLVIQMLEIPSFPSCADYYLSHSRLKTVNGP